MQLEGMKVSPGSLVSDSDELQLKPLQVDKLVPVPTMGGTTSAEGEFSAMIPNKSASKPLMDEMGKVSGSLCGNLQDQVCFGADARDKALHMEYSHVIGCNGMEPTNGKGT